MILKFKLLHLIIKIIQYILIPRYIYLCPIEKSYKLTNLKCTHKTSKIGTIRIGRYIHEYINNIKIEFGGDVNN